MNRKSMNKWGLAAAAGLLLVATSACASTQAASSDQSSGAKGSFKEIVAAVKPDPGAVKLLPADIKERGVITMAADLHYPPTSFLAQDNKTAIGYNVDIATLLGRELGLKVEVKNVPWDNVIPGIAAGRYDFTATNMTPTPARLKVLDMVTYWAPGSSLIVAKGNPLGLSIADESVCGKKIAVMTGSSQQQDYLPLISKDCKAAGHDPVKAVNLGDVEDALTQLVAKRLDGVFSDTSQLAWAARQQSQSFELLSPQYQKEVGDNTAALGLRKNSPLTPAIHAAMQSLMNSPAYMAALNRWGLGAGAIDSSEALG